MRLRAIRWVSPLAFALALACSSSSTRGLPPLDRFYYPTGIAVRHEPPGCTGGTAGCQTQLLVVSSNFDVLYDQANGGTVIAVDVGQAFAAAAAGAPSPLPLQPLGAVRIGSFGGGLAIVDPETCPGWTGPAEALVASRSQIQLYRIGVSSQGDLSCGPGCVVPLDSSLADSFDVAIACGSFATVPGAPPSQQALAFVTYLRTPDAHGWLSQVDLLPTDASGVPTSPITPINMQMAPTGESLFDPTTMRLYVTGRYSQSGYAPLRWLDLASPGTPPASINVFPTVSGADLRGIALSTDHTRAYVGLRLYDASAANVLLARPSTDIAGAMAVIDLTALTAGSPTAGVVRVVPLDRGVTEIRTIARPGQRDLVAVTATDDSTLTLYDDEIGAIVKTFTVCDAVIGGSNQGAPGPCNSGDPLTGVQPYGLAVEPIAGGKVRLYVGSFDRGFINVLEIDPLNPIADPAAWIRIGPERQ